MPDGERLRPTVVAGLRHRIQRHRAAGVAGADARHRPAIRGFLAGVVARPDRGVRLVARLVLFEAPRARGQHPRHDGVADAGRRPDDAGVGTVRGEWSSSVLLDAIGPGADLSRDIGAIGGFVAYTYALRHLPVSFVSLYAYINPIIAVALGVLLLHEPFTPRMAVAAALVFAGVAVVRWTRAAAQRSCDAFVHGQR